MLLGIQGIFVTGVSLEEAEVSECGRKRLRYTIRQVKWPQCGLRVERVPWARPGSRFTLLFENQVAYLAQRCRTTVAQQIRTTWRGH